MTLAHTTPAPATATVPHWGPPTGIAPRGTLVVLPGRGEHGLVYERFGRRLASDGYVVHALHTTPEQDADTVRAATAAALGEAPAAPVVLVGSDTGALQALRQAADADARLPVDGVVLAGTAATADPAARTVPSDVSPGEGWEAELEARTACPTHRKRLTDDAAFVRGGLAAPVPEHLRAPEARTGLPALVLHGEADTVTPLDQARVLAANLPAATFGVLHEGRHDVLNEASHRTTAAAVVQWLERLRAGSGLAPILTIEPAKP